MNKGLKLFDPKTLWLPRMFHKRNTDLMNKGLKQFTRICDNTILVSKRNTDLMNKGLKLH